MGGESRCVPSSLDRTLVDRLREYRKEMSATVSTCGGVFRREKEEAKRKD